MVTFSTGGQREKPILKDEIKILKSYELPNDASNDWIASQRFSQRNWTLPKN